MSPRSDVLFVFPPAPGYPGAFKNHLGAAYLRAALARAGIASAQYLSDAPGTIDAVAADILRQKSPIVGFTVYDANARLALALAQSLKRQRRDVRVVFGGPAVTFNAHSLMERHAVIDACLLGEAEETAAPIFTRLLKGRDLEDTQPGLVFRRDGEVVCTPLAPLVGSTGPGGQDALDVTPSPYLSGILSDGRAGVLTGRGCTHHCQYCCFAALGRMRLRLHSIERVVAELEYVAAQQKRSRQRFRVKINDDAFTLLPQRAKALCRVIADRKLDLLLSCITRADAVDEELIRLMWEAGFRSIAFGLESAVPSVLRAIGKVRPPDWPDADLEPERRFVEQVRSSVATAKKYGFKVGVSIILGLPTETVAEGAATLRFVRALPVDYYSHNVLWVYPGTPLWETHDKYQIGCGTDEIGLPVTRKYPYEVTRLKPGQKSVLEQEAQWTRLQATDALYGCSGQPREREGTNVVVVEADELSPHLADWLREVLAVHGIVVQVYPRRKRGAGPLDLERDRDLLRRHLVPARYHIQLQPGRRRREQESWRLACARVDLYGLHSPHRLSITASNSGAPLVAWAGGREGHAALCEISQFLRQPDRLRPLLGRIGTPEGAAFAVEQMSAPPALKYPGRWLAGKVPCRSLARIEADGQGRVRCCRQGEPIGQVGDSREALSKRWSELARKAAQRRGCSRCPNRHCPRCPFPGVDDQTYCGIMSRQQRILGALRWANLHSTLPLLIARELDRTDSE